MHYGDFRRVVYRADRKPQPAPENRLRSWLLLLQMISVLAVLVWYTLRPILRW